MSDTVEITLKFLDEDINEYPPQIEQELNSSENKYAKVSFVNVVQNFCDMRYVYDENVVEDESYIEPVGKSQDVDLTPFVNVEQYINDNKTIIIKELSDEDHEYDLTGYSHDEECFVGDLLVSAYRKGPEMLDKYVDSLLGVFDHDKDKARLNLYKITKRVMFDYGVKMEGENYKCFLLQIARCESGKSFLEELVGFNMPMDVLTFTLYMGVDLNKTINDKNKMTILHDMVYAYLISLYFLNISSHPYSYNLKTLKESTLDFAHKCILLKTHKYTFDEIVIDMFRSGRPSLKIEPNNTGYKHFDHKFVSKYNTCMDLTIDFLNGKYTTETLEKALNEIVE